MEIALDTSSILFGFEKKIDAFDIAKEHGYTPIVSKGVIKELEKLASSKSKKSIYAKLALNVIKAKKVKIVDSSEYVDSWLAKNKVVCTNDLKLRRKLKEKGIRLLRLLLVVGLCDKHIIFIYFLSNRLCSNAQW